MLRHACGYALGNTGTAPGRSRAGLAIGRSPARQTPRWRRIGSRTSGGIELSENRPWQSVNLDAAGWRPAQVVISLLCEARQLPRRYFAMNCSDVAPSRLPSLLLPCPHCGSRMVITAVEPALLADGATANDLRDVTHGSDQSGRSPAPPDSVFPSQWRSAAHAVARRINHTLSRREADAI
jgi:hypothetical protein